MNTQEFEKLGAFYLGRLYDLASAAVTDDLLLYDSKDLTTHAVCVGMTGSGKTGLCVGLIEEAAIDGVPAIVIDPKGDLANLMLTFPELKPDDFRPWVDSGEAESAGTTVDQLAADKAKLWAEGLAEWGQDGERIARLKEAVDVAIYTPGSSAGLPVSVLGSLAAPAAAVVQDSEALADKVVATTTALLTLAGIDADPVQSREHILISSILKDVWSRGRGLDLAGLINFIQKPPFTRVGVMELESFFPADDRFELSLALNNLVAAPGFELWSQGEPLDVARALHSPSGRPRISIYSIAHLSEAERMSFVALLLSEVLAWTRAQPGTTSLRALVYMDEIFGYFPPVANPPSKAPLLTMLKQARAHGVGVVLATQNPVDLDYKGLSNAGTWFIGRLQTERDKQRVMEGLEGAAAQAGGGFDREEMGRILAGLGKRVFLMNNVHEEAPVTFQTRWALSYLAGPITQPQIRTLMDPLKLPAPQPETAVAPIAPTAAALAAAEPAVVPTAPTAAAPAAAAAEPAAAASAGKVPMLPPDVPQYFASAPDGVAGTKVAYRPMVFGSARVAFIDSKSQVDETRKLDLLVPITDEPIPVRWDGAVADDVTSDSLGNDPVDGATFGELPEAGARADSYRQWKKDLADWLYANERIELLRSPAFGVYSKPGEGESDFRIRLQQNTREQRDQQVDKLRKKYAGKAKTLETKLRRAEQAIDRESEQSRSAKVNTAISIGATMMGAFLGRKGGLMGGLGRATTAARSGTRAVQQARDVKRAEDNVEAISQQIQDLNTELESEIEELESVSDPLSEELEAVELKPSKTNIRVDLVALVWVPGRGY